MAYLEAIRKNTGLEEVPIVRADILELFGTSEDVEMDSKGSFRYFSYGSNHLEQMRERLKNPKLECKPAVAPDYFLVFAGKSHGWGGAQTSLVPFQKI